MRDGLHQPRSALGLGFMLALVASAGPGCDGGASASSGLTAQLRIAGGQYEAGELTVDTRGTTSPTVDTIRSNNTHVFPGAQGRSVSGSVSGTAVAVLIGLSGDNAHWLLPVGVPDLDVPGNFTFGGTMSFSSEVPVGNHALVIRAIDAHGAQGPAQALTLKVDSPVPVGALVVQLTWDTEADLDLHVRVPNPKYVATDPMMKPYKDVWSKGPLALPNGPTYTQAEIDAAGQIGFDSNARCQIDGVRNEALIFPKTPPSGTYEVRIDAYSLCAEATARWYVAAFMGDALLGDYFGQAIDRDTALERDPLLAHTAASGTLAFTFVIP
jgi:hypothetical protein